VAKRGQWLRPDKAVQLVARRLGKSIGASRPILCDAMSSGEVQVRSVADPKRPQYLPAELWANAEFDLDRNVVRGGDQWRYDRGLHGECEYEALEISAEDLEYWLAPWARATNTADDAGSGRPIASAEQASSTKSKRKPRRDGKRLEIAPAIAALDSSEKWKMARDGQRCEMVEEHLERPKGWCKPRTLSRAIADRVKSGSSSA
jgi:hypothetical protein